MQIPRIPDNDKQRVNALHRLNMLDTGNEERFDRITRIAKQLFNVPIALVSLVDEDRQWFKSKIGMDDEEKPRDTSFCGHAILKDDIMIVEDATRDNRFHDNPYVTSDPNIKFYLGCPLKVKNQFNVGTLCLLDSKPRQFTEAEQAIMRDLADMVQSDLESVQVSTTDVLTGLTNRRGFLMIGEYVFNLCQRNQASLVVLFFDLNKFKLINDTYGHAEGDEVLQIFSDALVHHFRNSDVVARLGGDEFCVLCSHLSKNDINNLLKRFEKSFIKQTNKPYKIGYSVGYIQFDEKKHHSLQDLLNKADEKMYVNKQQSK